LILEIPEGEVISLNLGALGIQLARKIPYKTKSATRVSSLFYGRVLSKQVLSINSLAFAINFLLICPLTTVSLSLVIYSYTSLGYPRYFFTSFHWAFDIESFFSFKLIDLSVLARTYIKARPIVNRSFADLVMPVLSFSISLGPNAETLLSYASISISLSILGL
jgi:hypothetical protein